MIRIICLFLTVFAFNADAMGNVEDMGLNLSTLRNGTIANNTLDDTNNRSRYFEANNQLSNYAYDVGVDVSSLSTAQLDSIAGSYDKIPSAIFCEEHGEFEIQLSGNDLWERTKLMKLQKSLGSNIAAH